MTHAPDLVRTDCHSPLGKLHLAAGPRGLAGVWFEGQKHLPSQLDGAQIWPHDPTHPVLQEAERQLLAYFEQRLQRFELPLDLSAGTAFQQQVWAELRLIGHGQRSTYGELGRRLGRPQAARAVGAAVGRNPLSIVVPCHRVLGQDGRLTGYAGGLPRKTALLHLESTSL